MKKLFVLILSILFSFNIANAEQGQFRIGALILFLGQKYFFYG
jgi:hypothetical protein